MILKEFLRGKSVANVSNKAVLTNKL